MSHHLKELPPDQALEAAFKELDDVAALQPHSSDAHKLNFLRGFKCSNSSAREQIVRHASERLKTHYDNEKHLEGTIWLVAAGNS